MGTQSEDQKQSAKKQKSMASKSDEGEQKSDQQKKKSGQNQPQDGSEQVRNDRTTDGEIPPGEIGDLRDQRGAGRWGRLPKTVIQRVYDNGKRKLPEKYRILLEDYFRKLPERSPR